MDLVFSKRKRYVPGQATSKNPCSGTSSEATVVDAIRETSVLLGGSWKQKKIKKTVFFLM